MKKTTSQSKKISLEVKKRDLTGKKAKKLRKQGFVLGNIYGQDTKSQSIMFNFKDFIKIYKTVKETGIVYLNLDNKEIPCLIKNLQLHPLTENILHVDFRKIDLKKKIETEVPIKTINQSEAVSQKGGILLIQSHNLLIEVLPEDIPQVIEIDISNIKDIGQEIKVADLQVNEKYTIKTPKDRVIVSVIAHKEESVAPETTLTQPEIATEKQILESTIEEKEKPTEKERTKQQENKS